MIDWTDISISRTFHKFQDYEIVMFLREN